MSFQPSTEFQLQFLKQLQRIFNEGEFVATYKFALLNALADISIEREPEIDGSLRITLLELGEKFLELYWSHARPFGGRGSAQVLRSATGRQAALITLLQDAQETYSTLAAFRASSDWTSSARIAARKIKEQPLLLLQVMGGERHDFLYPSTAVNKEIVLNPGIAQSFKAFYPLILHLVRGHWISHLRSMGANRELIGTHADLEDFLFGTQRNSLDRASELLGHLQNGRCFYCGKTMHAEWQVDHFIPWSRYPRDLGHNFVLAHAQCNLRKSDTLAAASHLQRWLMRNDEHGDLISAEFNRTFLCDAHTSCRIAEWSYELDVSASARLWLLERQYETINPGVLALFH